MHLYLQNHIDVLVALIMMLEWVVKVVLRLVSAWGADTKTQNTITKLNGRSLTCAALAAGDEHAPEFYGKTVGSGQGVSLSQGRLHSANTGPVH